MKTVIHYSAKLRSSIADRFSTEKVFYSADSAANSARWSGNLLGVGAWCSRGVTPAPTPNRTCKFSIRLSRQFYALASLR